MDINERQIVAILDPNDAPSRYDLLTDEERVAAGLPELTDEDRQAAELPNGVYILGPSHVAPLLLQIIGNPVLPNFINAELVVGAEAEADSVSVTLTTDTDWPESVAALETESHPIPAEFQPIIDALVTAAAAESGGDTIWLDALDAFAAGITDRELRERFARMSRVNALIAGRLKEAGENGLA